MINLLPAISALPLQYGTTYVEAFIKSGIPIVDRLLRLRKVCSPMGLLKGRRFGSSGIGTHEPCHAGRQSVVEGFE